MPAKKNIRTSKTEEVTQGDVAHSGSPSTDQDVKRRLGNFVGAGEQARKGSRTSGIGGQSIRKQRTDQRTRKAR